MTNEERMLATALRDLCGWHVGMVTNAGVVADYRGEPSLPCCIGELLPALDSPANWGHWLAWMQSETLERPKWMDLDDALPYNLLRWYVEWLDRNRDLTPTTPTPPSVLAWWKEYGSHG